MYFCLVGCSVEARAPLKIKAKGRHVYCSTSAEEFDLNQQRIGRYQEAGVSIAHPFDYLSMLQLRDLNENKRRAMSVRTD
jgi:hypothetical protein